VYLRKEILGQLLASEITTSSVIVQQVSLG